jgi:ankyrin repeat protein
MGTSVFALISSMIVILTQGCQFAPIETPMIDAASRGATHEVHALLIAGTDVNIAEKTGETALLLAVANAKTGTVNYLLQKGADPNARTVHGLTPLMAAASYPLHPLALSMAKLLVDAGADVNSRTVDGWTPLMFAAGRGHIQIVDFLISKGSHVAAVTVGGESAVSIAKKHGRDRVVRLLDDVKGKNVQQKSSEPSAASPP